VLERQMKTYIFSILHNFQVLMCLIWVILLSMPSLLPVRQLPLDVLWIDHNRTAVCLYQVSLRKISYFLLSQWIKSG
jgi:hypothetical protein